MLDRSKSYEAQMADFSKEEAARDGSSPVHPKQEEDGGAVQKQREVRGLRWLLICIGIFSANLLYGLDTTIAADIQASVSETYDNVTQLGWLGVGFTLGSTVAILPLGKAYAMFDTKWLFVGCLAMFSAGSALCGAAPTMNAVIVGRVWAGAGGAGMYLGGLNLVTSLCGAKEQPRYVAVTGFVFGTGCILGPVVGGLLSDSPATWRWAFYLNLVIFGAMAPIYIFALPSLPQQQTRKFSEKLLSLDWLGTLLVAGFYTCFALAFSLGGVTWPWGDARTIVLIVLFVVITAAFAVTQRYSFGTNSRDRLFPCEFLRDPQLVILNICMACGGAALFVSIYYVPLYFLFVQGDSGTEAAVRLLPFVCFYVVSVLLCGALMDRVGYHMAWYTLSGLFMTVGGVLMYTVGLDTAAASIYGYTVLLGIGMTTTQAGYALLPRLVAKEKLPEAIQFINISQGQSQLIGLAMGSAVFQSYTFSGLSAVLAGTEYSTSEIRAALAGARSRVLQTATPELRRRCLEVIVDSISRVWIMVIAAGALYTLCALFLPKRRFV